MSGAETVFWANAVAKPLMMLAIVFMIAVVKWGIGRWRRRVRRIRA